MKTPTVEMLKKGYIVIPKSLLENYFATHGQTEGRFEALIRGLMNVNYSDTRADSTSSATAENHPTACSTGRACWDGNARKPGTSSTQ